MRIIYFSVVPLMTSVHLPIQYSLPTPITPTGAAHRLHRPTHKRNEGRKTNICLWNKN